MEEIHSEQLHIVLHYSAENNHGRKVQIHQVDCQITGLHIQKAYTSLGISSMQILLLSVACIHFA